MTEESKPELAPIEGDKQEPTTLDEQIGLELVKHNYTEAKLQEFEEYLKLDIVDDDKESYLLVKDKRKEVKSYRVALEKYCKFKREDAVLIQKAWVKKENLLSGRLSVVEDHLEAKEKAYEKKIAEEKEARKRKQEEQLILRQQELTGIGVLYSDGKFSLGEVSFELSAIKESDNDIWNETIWPLYKQAYEAIEADRIEQERLTKEREAELKRQQEELELERKRLKDESDRLQAEKERQEAEAREKKAAQLKSRRDQIAALGFTYNGINGYGYYEYVILHCDVEEHGAADWDGLIDDAKKYVAEREKEEAEEKRKEQERKDIQGKRYAELLPYLGYGSAVDKDSLWCFEEETYQLTLQGKRAEYEKSEAEKKRKIEEDAAKKERERIEEEQREAEVNRKYELRKSRMSMLVEHDLKYHGDFEVLGEISEEAWMNDFNELKANRDEIIRKQEEERKAEELAKASDKEKWDEIAKDIEALRVLAGSLVMRSGQYRKKRQMLLEKLEEIKAL